MDECTFHPSTNEGKHKPKGRHLEDDLHVEFEQLLRGPRAAGGTAEDSLRCRSPTPGTVPHWDDARLVRLHTSQLL